MDGYYSQWAFTIGFSILPQAKQDASIQRPALHWLEVTQQSSRILTTGGLSWRRTEVMLQCSKCKRQFETQGALNGHQRTHSFFHFLGTLRPSEVREKERKEAHDKIVIAAIKHFSQNSRMKG